MLAYKYLLFIFLKILFSFNPSSATSFNKNNIFTAKHIYKTTTEPNEELLESIKKPIDNINQSYANFFKQFIDQKSTDLYTLTKKFVRFNLINETYNIKLRNEVKISHNNYPEMVKTISEKLSRILFQKTQVVMNLSEVVENAYVDYRFNLDKVNKSTTHVYYDSKSPKTFCDVSSSFKAKQSGEESWLTEPEIFKKNDFNSMISGYYNNQSLILGQSFKSAINETKLPVRPGYEKFYNDGLKQLYWDVECINRYPNSNFNKVKEVNLRESTVHVPSNIFKQNLAINMTAFWTESLNTQFKLNNELNPGLDWQYFCSSLGLYRQYPGAYWSVPPKEDFYDCRLQSWYMSAATSAKDVLILLDTSGSMTGIRLEIGKKLIEFLFDTFTDNDFFNIITYSDEVSSIEFFDLVAN